MIGIGIIGGGLRGRLFARALRRHARVIGVADPSPGAREAIRADGYQAYETYEALLTDQRPDAVIVATPDFAHRGPAVAVARSGAHLLVEKPLATTVADARAIRDAVREAGISCMVGFENHWNPHFVHLKDAVEDGTVGHPISQSATLSNTFFVPERMLAWAARSSPVWFLMPHVTDLACWLSGAAPVSVFARGSRGVLAARGIDTWDVVHASIELDDGGLLDLTSSWVQPEAAPGIADLAYRVVGASGAARVDLGDQGLTVVSDTYRAPWPVSGDINGEPIGTAAWMAQGFVRALESDQDLDPGIDQGVLVTETLAGVEHSLASGHPVTLDEVRERS